MSFQSAPGGLKTPRAAAVAGILFSVLLLTSIFLIVQTLRVHPRDPGDWLRVQAWKVALALNLIPFAGIAFLWFMGVLRDRLGAREHKLFATVFLGSGLLFVTMLFTTSASAGALLAAVKFQNEARPGPDTVILSRALAFAFLYVFAVRAAAVFVLVVSTIALRTGVLPRWLVIGGYVIGLVSLFTVAYVELLVCSSRPGCRPSAS